MEKLLTKNVTVLPSELCSDLEPFLIKRIREKYENTITKDEGYVFRVGEKIKVLSNHISPGTGYEIVFKVQFNANVLKPEVGDVIEGRIIIVDERGIFISVEDRMNVLVPASRLPDFSFDKQKKEFVRTSGEILKLGNEIKTRIVAIRYDKKFNCIGELV